MGQQQLLLVILVTIIVGIATVVAINVFGTAADEANRDAVRQDIMQAATAAQGIWARPTAMGGLGQNMGNLDDPRLIFSRGADGEMTYTDGEVENENGSYTVSGTGEGATSSLTITGSPSGGTPDMQLVLSRETDDDGSSYWELTWSTPEE